MEHLKWLSLVLLIFILAACSSTANPPSPAPPGSSIARIEITPSALLLTEAGEAHELTAQAYNSLGEPVDADFVWSSNNETAIKVDSTGRVTSLRDLGSAQIMVKAQGIAATPALALIADPVDGAMLVSDAQILAGPELVAPGPDGYVGAKLAYLLTDIQAPAVGTIMLAAEAAQLAGRVVSSTPEGNGVRVVLEVVPGTELFDAIDFEESFDLAAVEPVLEDLPGTVSVTRSAEGTSIQYAQRQD